MDNPTGTFPGDAPARDVTKGAARIGERVTQPTLRAFAHGTSGDAAALSFTFRGETEHTAPSRQASAAERRALRVASR